MSDDFPMRNQPVKVTCTWCSRAPRAGETYGPGPLQWDHLGICPECWDDTCKDPEDE